MARKDYLPPSIPKSRQNRFASTKARASAASVRLFSAGASMPANHPVRREVQAFHKPGQGTASIVQWVFSRSCITSRASTKRRKRRCWRRCRTGAEEAGSIAQLPGILAHFVPGLVEFGKGPCRLFDLAAKLVEREVPRSAPVARGLLPRRLPWSAIRRTPAIRQDRASAAVRAVSSALHGPLISAGPRHLDQSNCLRYRAQAASRRDRWASPVLLASQRNFVPQMGEPAILQHSRKSTMPSEDGAGPRAPDAALRDCLHCAAFVQEEMTQQEAAISRKASPALILACSVTASGYFYRPWRSASSSARARPLLRTPGRVALCETLAAAGQAKQRLVPL